MKILKVLLLASMMTFVGFARASETVEGAKKDYASAKAEVSAQLDALDRKIDEIKASTTQKSTAAKERTLKQAEDARVKLRAEYDSMKDSSEASWKSFKKKLARTMNHINAKAQSALKN